MLVLVWDLAQFQAVPKKCKIFCHRFRHMPSRLTFLLALTRFFSKRKMLSLECMSSSLARSQNKIHSHGSCCSDQFDILSILFVPPLVEMFLRCTSHNSWHRLSHLLFLDDNFDSGQIHLVLQTWLKDKYHMKNLLGLAVHSLSDTRSTAHQLNRHP